MATVLVKLPADSPRPECGWCGGECDPVRHDAGPPAVEWFVVDEDGDACCTGCFWPLAAANRRSGARS